MPPKQIPGKRPPAKQASSSTTSSKVKPVTGKGLTKKPATGGPKAKTSTAKGTTVSKTAPSKTGGTLTKGNQNDVKNAKPKEPTKEDKAAIVIQKWVRRLLAKKTLTKMKKEKEDYEELMEKLEREAYLAMVKKEQERAEKEREKEEAERRRRREMIKRQKRILEAAFDGDNDEILTVLKEVDAEDTKSGVPNNDIGRTIRARNQLKMLDCEDANSNTPLSEAASGGHAETVQLLIDRGADVNSRGQFQRTPLYRAAFAGHLEATQVLLQSGADPRLYAGDGATPQQVASVEGIVQLFEMWDISSTDMILERIESVKEQRREEDRKRQEAEMAKLENQLKEAQTTYDACQRKLNKAYEELNKRIFEHDKCMQTGYKTDLTLTAVHDAEKDLELAKLDNEKARDKLLEVKLTLREQQKMGENGADVIGIKVNFKELDEVLMRDVGDKIKSDGRWPLIIDSSSRTAQFLRYRDTNMLNALHPNDMQPQTIRMAVLGSIRFGKILVLDLMEVDMFQTCQDRFDEVHKGLMDDIMSKEILKNEKYVYLLKDTDGPEYNKNQFNEARTQNFQLFVVTKIEPSKELMDKFYPIHVVID